MYDDDGEAASTGFSARIPDMNGFWSYITGLLASIDGPIISGVTVGVIVSWYSKRQLNAHKDEMQEHLNEQDNKLVEIHDNLKKSQ